MADLLITKTRAGVALVTTTDPFSSLEIHRIDRESWDATPAKPGIYLLYGFVEGEPAVYVGMSTTSMRDRIRSHHVTPRKNWFGVLFAIPTSSPLLLPAIEAELIRRVYEASVVSVIDNRAHEERWLDSNDVHLAPALDAIVAALEMLLGSDIFTPQDDEPAQTVDAIERPQRLARVYKNAARNPSPRQAEDSPAASHRWAGAISAWGSFEADEPDTRFRVLTGSSFKPATVDPSHATYRQQQRVARMQQALIDEGALDPDGCAFVQDHVFDNWTRAAHVVSGFGSYSGGYHWQRIDPPRASPQPADD